MKRSPSITINVHQTMQDFLETIENRKVSYLLRERFHKAMKNTMYENFSYKRPKNTGFTYKRCIILDAEIKAYMNIIPRDVNIADTIRGYIKEMM